MTQNPANKPDGRVHAKTTDGVVVRYDRDEGAQRIRTLIHSTVGSVPTQPEEEALDWLIEQLRLANIDATNALAREESLCNTCERALALLETERFLEDVDAKPVRAVLRGALGDDQ